MATPSGVRTCTSSLLAMAFRSCDPKNSRWAAPTLVMIVQSGLPAQNGGCCLLGARLDIAAGDADQRGFRLAQCARTGRCVQGLDDIWNDDLQEIDGNIICRLAA